MQKSQLSFELNRVVWFRFRKAEVKTVDVLFHDIIRQDHVELLVILLFSRNGCPRIPGNSKYSGSGMFG